MSSFITTNATQDVFELVLARPVVVTGGEHPSLVHVWWRAPQQGQRLVQIYVDDELFDATLDVSQHEVMVELDRTRPHRIELLAVPIDEPDSIWRTQPGLLNAWQPRISDSLSVDVIRDESLPIDTLIQVELDGSVVAESPLWTDIDMKSAELIDGSLAFHEVSGLGVGGGELGAGALGFDGTMWRWKAAAGVGEHVLNIFAGSEAGESVALPVAITKHIEHLPSAVTGLQLNPPSTLAWDGIE